MPADRATRAPDVAFVACPPERAAATLPTDATPSECRTDADCAAGRNGRCLRLSNHGSHGPSLEATRCSYDGCLVDADCETPHATCICGRASATEVGDGHFCAGGECTVDADCGEGHYCRRGASGRYCHSPADECLEETSCGPGTGCQREADGIYRCGALPAVFGLVDGLCVPT